MTRGQPINFDQDTYSLEVRTKSENGKKTDLVVAMYTTVSNGDTDDRQKIGHLHIRVESLDIRYRVYHCDQEMKQFPEDPPDTAEKTWTITKASTKLFVDCNGIRLLSLDFKLIPSFECSQTWSRVADEIVFPNVEDAITPADTASIEYRIIPYCNSLPDADGLESPLPDVLPVIQATVITVVCSNQAGADVFLIMCVEHDIFEGVLPTTCHSGLWFSLTRFERLLIIEPES